VAGNEDERRSTEMAMNKTKNVVGNLAMDEEEDYGDRKGISEVGRKPCSAWCWSNLLFIHGGLRLNFQSPALENLFSNKSGN